MHNFELLRPFKFRDLNKNEIVLDLESGYNFGLMNYCSSNYFQQVIFFGHAKIIVDIFPTKTLLTKSTFI